MADRSHLVPTGVTDSRGRQTTVYRRPETNRLSRPQRAIPAPSQTSPRQSPGSPVPDVAPSQCEARAARQRENSEFNRRWGSGDRPNEDALSARAEESVGIFADGTADAEGFESKLAFDEAVRYARAKGRHAAVITAARYGAVYHGLEFNDEVSPADATEFQRMTAEEPVAYVDYDMVLVVAEALLDANLMRADEVPEEGADTRFLAHLCADRRWIIDYTNPDGREALMALIDEHPERLHDIARMEEEGVEVEAMRMVLSGETSRALSSGAL